MTRERAHKWPKFWVVKNFNKKIDENFGWGETHGCEIVPASFELLTKTKRRIALEFTTSANFNLARSRVSRASLGPNPLLSADHSHSRVFKKKKRLAEVEQMVFLCFFFFSFSLFFLFCLYLFLFVLFLFLSPKTLTQNPFSARPTSASIYRFFPPLPHNSFFFSLSCCLLVEFV